jgi:hypothetical protein
MISVSGVGGPTKGDWVGENEDLHSLPPSRVERTVTPKIVINQSIDRRDVRLLTISLNVEFPSEILSHPCESFLKDRLAEKLPISHFKCSPLGKFHRCVAPWEKCQQIFTGHDGGSLLTATRPLIFPDSWPGDFNQPCDHLARLLHEILSNFEGSNLISTIRHRVVIWGNLKAPLLKKIGLKSVLFQEFCQDLLSKDIKGSTSSTTIETVMEISHPECLRPNWFNCDGRRRVKQGYVCISARQSTMVQSFESHFISYVFWESILIFEKSQSLLNVSIFSQAVGYCATTRRNCLKLPLASA